MSAAVSQPGVRLEAFHWWIDAVGGYLTFTNPTLRIGQAGCRENDVAIFGDLSAHHADLFRGETGVVLTAHSDVRVNGKPGREFLLRDGDQIRMRSVEMRYHQPHAWCTTARFELVSHHRLPMALDGVILLSEVCMLGPRSDAHVQTLWAENVFVNWYRGQFWLRCSDKVRIDDAEYPGWGPLRPDSEVEGSWGAFRWEPVGTAEHRG